MLLAVIAVLFCIDEVHAQASGKSFATHGTEKMIYDARIDQLVWGYRSPEPYFAQVQSPLSRSFHYLKWLLFDTLFFGSRGADVLLIRTAINNVRSL